MTGKARKRVLSLLLCLVMVASLLPAMGAAAADEPTVVDTGDQVKDDGVTPDAENDLRLNKSLLDNGDGTYSIVMEGYANAEITEETTTEKIPTDFVIVVDQSGSMDTRDMAVMGYSKTTNKNLETIAADAEANNPTFYYYKDGDNYYRVYAKRGYLYQYHPANSLTAIDVVNNSSMNFSWFDGEQESDTSNPIGQFYYKDGDVMRLLYISIRKYNITRFAMTLSYLDASGASVSFQRPRDSEILTNTNDLVFNGGIFTEGIKAMGNGDEYNFQWVLNHSVYINHDMFSRHMGYTELCYQDAQGVEHVIPTTNGTQTTQYCNSDHNAITDYQNGQRMQYSGLYVANNYESRLASLKSALGSFARTIAQEEDDFGAVDNRVSIIGFSSPGYNNTELLTGENLTVQNNNGVQMESARTSDYATALVGSTNGSLGAVNPKITAAIGAITANGGTQPENGLEMAYNVLNNRSVTEYEIRSGDHAGETVPRNQVVIFFTDGRPGNYAYVNQYAEANEVVAKAKGIKQDLDATIFSIGVFGESDGNPLTYPAHRTSSAQPGYEYELGWVETYQAGSQDYYYLNRHWRQNDAAEYGANPNDTIFSYMSVVSSNYPDAELFITQEWLNGNHSGHYLSATDGIRHKDTAEDTNKYYRMASNQQSLIDAFLQAVTMSNSETIIDSNTTLGADGVLTDKVNTADFTISEAGTATAQVVNIQGGEVDDALTAQLVVDDSKLKTDGIVTVTGFDYSKYHLSKKVVVTITGLVPNKVGTLYSNDGYATIVDGNGDVQARTTSPELELDPAASKTVKILDFNMIANIDANVSDVNRNATSAPGGTFDWEKAGDDLTFTPDISTEGKAWDVSAFSGVNQTMYLKDAAWKQAVVIPAASVYVADNLKTLYSDYDDGVSGFDANVVATATTTENTKTSRTITFYGTGIDIYCTTDDESGWITANIYAGSEIPDPATDTGKDGETVYPGTQALKGVLVKNNSVDTHYNCPTIRFTMDKADIYTVKINTSVGSNYKFEGVRIYHPADADAQDYYDAPEKAGFTRVREILIDANTFSGTVDGTAVSGAVYVETYTAPAEGEETGTTDPKTITDVKTYEDYGPRGEVYLEPNRAIAFKVNTTDPVLIGMSSADGTAVDYAVTNVTKEGRVSTGTISSTVDMYYEAQPDANGYICIKNNGESGLLAITNVRAGAEGAASFSVDQGLMDYLAHFDELIEQAQLALKTVWNDDADAAPKMLSALWQLLVQSFSQLFNGIGQW